jgi:hypothetical protein
VPRKEPSIESRIKEHKKFRKQCQVRIVTGKKLIIVCILVAILLTWFVFEFWKLGAGIVLLSIGSLMMEIWAHKKHDRAINELTSDT